MAGDEKDRRGGAKTARPTSVGPHHRDRAQEDPGNPGIRPEEGYGAEIARNNAAAVDQPAGKAKSVTPPPQAETEDESGSTEEVLRRSGAPRDAPPMRGTAED
jgi:hypothetical protein